MKKLLLIPVIISFMITQVKAQTEPNAGNWKTWLIESGKAYRLPAPPPYKHELDEVLEAQRNLDAKDMEDIQHWNAGSPGYRWYSLISKLWTNDISGNGALSNMLIGTTIYDATIAAWDTKYAYNRPRPFVADSRITVYGPKPESPSFPCEHSVAAGAAVTIVSHFWPAMADSAKRMAKRAMESRVAAGLAFPSDTRAGFELGKKIAEKEIEATKDFVTKKQWDGKMPTDPKLWKGKFALLPTAGLNKTLVLDSASQFRPGPPPDFAKDMEELKNFKQTFKSRANAFYYASRNTSNDLQNEKMFEYNLHLNAPRAARLYAAANVTFYDAFTACWDAKYAYWGTRPDQYDTTYTPLMQSPPFPGYPSGHAMMSGSISELLSYFFPAERALFQKIAQDGAESRFHAGIHFRSDNDAGLALGRKVAEKVVEHLRSDGADGEMVLTPKEKSALKARN